VITTIFQRIPAAAALAACGLILSGCQQKATPPARTGAGMQGLPVQTVSVTLQPVAQTSEYVSTIKSRRSATIQPQVSGNLTAILVHSGDRVKGGQVLMTIDARQQQSAVAAQRATARQKKALFDFNTTELERQRKLFEAGITSRDAFDQEQQAYQNAKADYEAAEQTANTQQELLAYYTIRAPFDGVVDVPVHLGDYVSPSTMLTTVDANQDLEAYIYIPAERAAEVHIGLPVDIADNSGKVLEHTRIDFISPQVDSNLQAILVKAPVHPTPDILRNAQMVKALVIWSTKPMPVVPVLAITRQGAQSFVYVVQQQEGHFIARELPVTLGETVGNSYSIASGLSAGDRVIVSATQFLVNNMPVMPLGGPAAH
jgi:RND family efflux transporter MFP subunit